VFTANIQSETAMMTMVRYRSDLQKACGSLHYRKTAYTELRLLCLWSVVGLSLTGLLFSMGFGAEIGQALMMAE
jgi:hypothetical protein